MRLLVFDPARGAAGDMITGALLHLGGDREAVVAAMASVVGEPGITLVTRAGIQGLLVETRAPVTKRTLADVVERVQSARAPVEAIAMALRVFGRMARAEEQVHGEMVHFHEVGADDAIAEVVGACTAYCSLSPDECTVLPVSLGGGSITGSHGIYPVPAPATLAILQEAGIPVRLGTADDGELCTPTGAALLAEFATSPVLPDCTGPVSSVGYGAGTRDPDHVPNVIRAMILDCSTPADPSQVDLLETSVDDVSPEILAYTFSRLLEEGAYDVSALPCTMKKGRPGHLVRVIAAAGDGERIATVMAAELGTLGVRCIPAVHRFVAKRSVQVVPVTINGQERSIRVKCGMLEGNVYSLKPEYDDTSRWARELGIPARTVARIAESQAWELIGKSRS